MHMFIVKCPCTFHSSSCVATSWATCIATQHVCTRSWRRVNHCMRTGPKEIKGVNVLTYISEHVGRSKTPIVDALLVLYPAFTAVLTLHQVQLLCAQELYELSNKDLPLRVHYLYERCRACARKMLQRQAADGELDRSGVLSRALWIYHFAAASESPTLCHA